MSELMEALKPVFEAHIEVLKKTKFQAVHTGARDWVQQSPLFTTREEAQGWLDNQLRSSHRKDDEGYIVEIQVDDSKIA